MLPTVRSLLSSNRSNESVSAELADLVGFDEIELVSELIDRRPEVVRTACVHRCPPLNLLFNIGIF